MRRQLKFSDDSRKLAAFMKHQHNGTLSFSFEGKHYEFQNGQHLKNTINKLLREINGETR